MLNAKFCQYQTLSTGKCLMWITGNQEFCKKHLGKKQSPKTQKIGRYRGDSKWQKEQGMFDSK